MAEGARMGVELNPSFQAGKSDRPLVQAFLFPPWGLGARAAAEGGRRRGEEAVAAAAPFPWRTRARARRDGGKLVRIRGGSTVV